MNKLDVFDGMLTVLLIIAIVLTICGCNNIAPNPEYFNSELNSIIKIENQIGCIIRYNQTRSIPTIDRVVCIPNTQIQYQQYKKIMGINYDR